MDPSPLVKPSWPCKSLVPKVSSASRPMPKSSRPAVPNTATALPAQPAKPFWTKKQKFYKKPIFYKSFTHYALTFSPTYPILKMNYETATLNTFFVL